LPTLNKIVALGFQSIGYRVEDGVTVSTDFCRIRFDKIDSPNKLDSYDGVLVPSGIFEKIKEEPNYLDTYYEVFCKRDLLLRRERELVNLVRKAVGCAAL
jgi:hypothetical protein